MQKKFLTNLALLLFLNLLVKPFWVLGIDRTVQNVVGVGDFGFYFHILNFSFLFNIILDLGITNFNNRNIAQHSHLLNKHISGILILKILLMAFYLVAVFGTGLIIGYSEEQFGMLAWVGANQFLLSLILYLRSNISGLLLFRTDSFLSVLDRLLMILFCSILLWGNVTDQRFKIEWFVYIQTASYAITALTAFIIVGKRASLKRLHWNRLFFLLILKKSFPFAILVLLMNFYNRIDSVMIERLLPPETGDVQVGIYAQAFRLLDAVNMIAFLFAVLLLPILSRMIKQRESVAELVALSFSLLITISVVVAVTSHFFGYEIMRILYPMHVDETQQQFLQRIGQSSHIFSVLMYGFIAVSTTYVFGTLLTANGNLKYLNLIAASGMLISLVLNISLIPGMLATGSAYASLCSQSITAIGQVILAKRLFRFKTDLRFLGRVSAYIACVYIFAFLSSALPFRWYYSAVILIVLSVGLSFLLRLLDIKNLIAILKTRDSVIN